MKAESFEDIHELYQKEMLSGPNLNFDTELESISRMRSKPIVKNKCLKEIVEAKGGHFFNILLWRTVVSNLLEYKTISLNSHSNFKVLI